MKGELEKEHVLTSIDHAFTGVRLEDGVSANMAEYNEAPWAAKAPHYLELARSDEREDWRKVSDTTLETRATIFHFSDPKGFRFYAPAFMRYAIRYDTGAEMHFIVDGIIYALSPDNNIFEKVPFEECFTPEQIAAIMRFLEYCAHHGPFDAVAATENLGRIRERLQRTRHQ